jgi:hypothetical protein
MTAETIIQSLPFFVIASEAKQSMLLHKEGMDCFVASLLAMTTSAAMTEKPGQHS